MFSFVGMMILLMITSFLYGLISFSNSGTFRF